MKIRIVPKNKEYIDFIDIERVSTNDEKFVTLYKKTPTGTKLICYNINELEYFIIE